VKTEDAALTPHEYTDAPDALRYGLSSLPFLPGDLKEEKPAVRDLRAEFFGKEKGQRGYYGFFKK
jgi:hypothetical protein